MKYLQAGDIDMQVVLRWLKDTDPQDWTTPEDMSAAGKPQWSDNADWPETKWWGHPYPVLTPLSLSHHKDGEKNISPGLHKVFMLCSLSID